MCHHQQCDTILVGTGLGGDSERLEARNNRDIFAYEIHIKDKRGQNKSGSRNNYSELKTFFFNGHTHDIRKFLGQGLNLSSSYDLSHS